VITGGTRGFGLAVAQAYAQEGAAVVVASRSQEAVRRAVEGLRVQGAQAEGLPCDMGELEQVQALADHTVATFGRFDVWMNNAAITAPYGPVMHINPQAVEGVVRTNILGFYYGSLVAMRHFVPRGSGKLINILGAGDRRPHPMQAAYTSTKAWAASFTTALAKDYEGSGVGVYAFNPGMMDTDLIQKLEAVEGYESRLDSMDTVMRMLSRPAEAATRKAVWLASAETNGRTGLVVRETSTLKVLGGMLREGLRGLLRRPKRPIEIEITTVSSTMPVGIDEKTN
jgi:NAD(P)-dependent dehydrogenase (short-subunit alcohol dehydrogenase family)